MEYLEDAGERSKERPAYMTFLRSLYRIFIKVVDFLGPWAALLIFAAFLSAWEFSVSIGWLNPLFYPSPSTIAATFVDMLSNGLLTEDFITTVRRSLSGFLIGGSLGLLMGLSMGWSRRLRVAIDPIIAALHPVPKISFLPVILIIFGIGDLSRIVMISISTFFPMLINSMAGVVQINSTFFDVAKNYGADRRMIFKRIVIPASLPMVLTGTRLALVMSLTIAIVLEMRYGNEGLGANIWLAWEILKTPLLYATVAILAILGMISNFSLLWLTRLLVPWHEGMGR